MMTAREAAGVRSCLLPCAPTLHSQPRHHLLHPLLAHVGVNLGGGDALVAQQRLDIHQFRPGVEQVGGVSQVGRAQDVPDILLIR